MMTAYYVIQKGLSKYKSIQRYSNDTYQYMTSGHHWAGILCYMNRSKIQEHYDSCGGSHGYLVRIRRYLKKTNELIWNTQ